jgi:hypothetical protein
VTRVRRGSAGRLPRPMGFLTEITGEIRQLLRDHPLDELSM